MPQNRPVHQVLRRAHGDRARRALNEHGGRQQDRATPSETLTPRKKLALIVSFAVLISSMGAVLFFGGLLDMKKYQVNIYNYLADKEMDVASHILKKLVEDCEHLRLVELQVLTLTNSEELGSLVKQEIQPIQDTIASLMVQTSKYEQMGGRQDKKPQQFMNTALKTLAKLEETLMDSARIQQWFTNMQAAIKQFLLNYKIFVGNGGMIIDARYDGALAVDNLVISPPPELERALGSHGIEKLLSKYDFETVISMANHLVPLLEERDVRLKGIVALEQSFGLAAPTHDTDLLLYEIQFTALSRKHPELSEANERLGESQEAVLNYLEANRTIIQLLEPHHTKVAKRIENFVKSFKDIEAKRRDGYLELTETVRDDLQNLKERILRL